MHQVGNVYYVHVRASCKSLERGETCTEGENCPWGHDCADVRRDLARLRKREAAKRYAKNSSFDPKNLGRKARETAAAGRGRGGRGGGSRGGGGRETAR